MKLEGTGYYHVMNRVHGREFLFDEEAAEAFCRIMRSVAQFSGVEVITYCVMSNHIHLLLKVPPRKKLSDKELFARYEKLAARSSYSKMHGQYRHYQEQGNKRGMADVRSRLAARMYDLSAFMKELKQRFTQWYNSRGVCWGRGTFWSDRFKSVVVEGKGHALATVAAYIDMNPVRAHMVSDPKEYRWCGYAAALAGNPPAIRGLKSLLAGFGRGAGAPSDKGILAMYRVLLFGTAERCPGAVSRADIEATFATEGMLPSWEVAKHKARWLTTGLLIGSKSFVSRHAPHWNQTLRLKRKLAQQGAPNEEGWFALRGGVT